MLLHVISCVTLRRTISPTCSIASKCVYVCVHVTVLFYVQVYCKEAVGAVFVYDVRNEYSLYNLEQWRRALNSLVTQQDGNPIPSIMVGTKVSPFYDEHCSEIFQACVECNKKNFLSCCIHEV